MATNAETVKIDTTIKDKDANVETLWKNRKEKWNKTRIMLLVISLLIDYLCSTPPDSGIPSWQRSIRYLGNFVNIHDLSFP